MKTLTDEEQTRIFDLYWVQLQDEFDHRRHQHASTHTQFRAILTYLWEFRNDEAKRAKAEVAKALKVKIPNLGQPEQTLKLRCQELPDILSGVTGRLEQQSPPEFIGIMTLYRAQGRDPLALKFTRHEARMASSISAFQPTQGVDDFERFWLPYRRNYVETKVIIGQPRFKSAGDTHYRNIKSFSQAQPMESGVPDSKIITPHYLRYWDFQSALKIYEMLLGIDQPNEGPVGTIKEVLHAPTRVKIESSNQEYDPLNDYKLRSLRKCNVIALGYPRDNAVLLNYQRNRGLVFQVQPDNDNALGDETLPRVVQTETGDITLDELDGASQVKRCVLTRRNHSFGGNVVTLIAGNSSRATAALTDALCEKHACNKLFEQIRITLPDENDNLPLEYQCLVAVEFVDEVQEIRVEDCIVVVPSASARSEGSPKIDSEAI